jgi:DNA-directed RNA polymerase
MLIQPVPWTSFDSGGLILHGPSAVRANKRNIFKEADKAGEMAQLYEGLNTLNSVPWYVV